MLSSNYIGKIDLELTDNGLYTLRGWQKEERTREKEKAEWSRRIKDLRKRKIVYLDNHLLVEPRNEAELFGLFMTIYALRPHLFDFEPIDYNANNGIDIIARNRSKHYITEGEHSYVELKITLEKTFNHSFQYLRWIICWDFGRNIGPGSEFISLEGTERRFLETDTDNGTNKTVYFLTNKRESRRIQVIRLEEYLRQELSLSFTLPPQA